ncbi:Amino acid/polyamine transporter [Trema orientale]|uniref:Amino acid/polyamine transporter n=1 Tax=Trema orientale TaxID=63057 RepID=A0A2P5B2F5_TREOI|nr:Amino acid/polyamine transporter [Trema orientale]
MLDPLFSSSSPISQDLLEKQKQHDDDQGNKPQKSVIPKKGKGLPLVPLIFLIYFQVSGGPYGQESVVGGAGPLLAIAGFILFPILWSIPEALVTAELATTFPNNGGFVVWTHTAFGPFWGYLMGSWKFLSGVINLASFPGLCIDYVDAISPYPNVSTLTRYSVIFFSTSFLSLLNFTGIRVVGHISIPLAVLSLLPFLVLSLIAIPQIDPGKWVVVWKLSLGRHKNWKMYFHALFWNLNCWDSVSTLVGEVKNPEKALPKALLSSMGLTSVAYLIPLLATTGAMSPDPDDWKDGYYAAIGEELAGPWLKRLIKLGAVLSGLGLYQAQLSSCSYQLHGMAELGLLPQFFGTRSGWFDTPWVGILVSTIISLLVAAFRFTNLRVCVNFLYSLGMFLEFGSFVYLRVKFPKAARPFKVPIGLNGLIGMCSVPSIFLLYVLCVATGPVYLVSFVLTLFGVLWYFLLKMFKANMWLKFNDVRNNKLADEDPSTTRKL